MDVDDTYGHNKDISPSSLRTKMAYFSQSVVNAMKKRPSGEMAMQFHTCICLYSTVRMQRLLNQFDFSRVYLQDLRNTEFAA